MRRTLGLALITGQLLTFAGCKSTPVVRDYIEVPATAISIPVTSATGVVAHTSAAFPESTEDQAGQQSTRQRSHQPTISSRLFSAARSARSASSATPPARLQVSTIDSSVKLSHAEQSSQVESATIDWAHNPILASARRRSVVQPAGILSVGAIPDVKFGQSILPIDKKTQQDAQSPIEELEIILPSQRKTEKGRNSSPESRAVPRAAPGENLAPNNIKEYVPETTYGNRATPQAILPPSEEEIQRLIQQPIQGAPATLPPTATLNELYPLPRSAEDRDWLSQEPFDGACVMTDEQVACHAAQQSSLANTLERERAVIQHQQCQDQSRKPRQRRCEDPCATSLRSRIIHYQAVQERNKAAHRALELFYAIAEIDNQVPLIDIALAELEKNQQRINALREENAYVSFDATKIDRQRNNLLTKRSELRLERMQASEQLQVFVGPCLCHARQIVPNVDLTVYDYGTNADAELQEGLQTRADLALLRTICNCLTDDTLGVVNKTLSLTQSLLGSSACPPICQLFKRQEETNCCEINVRRQQINELLCELEQQITSEIRTAAHEVVTRARMAKFAANVVDSWSQRLEDLETLQAANEATPFDITSAQIEKTQAQSDLIRAVFAWRLAQVKLRAAKGQLAVSG